MSICKLPTWFVRGNTQSAQQSGQTHGIGMAAMEAIEVNNK